MKIILSEEEKGRLLKATGFMEYIRDFILALKSHLESKCHVKTAGSPVGESVRAVGGAVIEETCSRRLSRVTV